MTAAGGGISAAGPLWNAFMSGALKNLPNENFPAPDPVIISKTMLNGQSTSATNPETHSILFYVDKNNPLGPMPENPSADPQFQNWEWTVQAHGR